MTALPTGDTRRDADEQLRAAFQALGETAEGACSEDDLDRIWRAVSGDLPAGERRALVERMAADPALAEAWRMAHAMHGPFRADVAAAPARRFAIWAPSWLAAAAVLVLGVAAALVYQVNRPVENEFRDAGGTVIESLVPAGTALPREAFLLRWAPGPPGARYHVRVTTDDLRVLATAADVASPEWRVEPEALTSLESGAQVLWQVDMSLPGGGMVSSQTFVVRVE